MMPDPDATQAPPEPASAPAALPEKEFRAVEAAVAGAAGLLIGRVLLGRAGGIAAGLAALGAGLLGKRPPPAPPAEPKSGSNGHSPPAPAASPFMQVRLQTSPVPPVDAVAALAAADAYAPMSLAVALPAEKKMDEPATEVATAPVTEISAPLVEDIPAQAEQIITPAAEIIAPPVVEAQTAEDAGAFAEMPALFESVSAAPVEPAAEVEPDSALPAVAPAGAIPLAALLERAASELEMESFPAPRPVTAPVPSPSAKTSPIPSLLEAWPVEFAEWKEEEEPGLRDDFLLIPDEAPKSLPALEPVVAALGESLLLAPEPDPNQPEMELESAAPPAPDTLMELPAASAPETSIAEDLSGKLETTSTPVPESAAPATIPPWAMPIVTAESAPEVSDVARAATAPVPDISPDADPLPVPRPITAPVRPIPIVPADAPALFTMPVPPIPVAEEPAAARVKTAPIVPPVSLPPLPDESPVESPFRIWQPAAAPAPAAATKPIPDPEEIWRQAAAELAALRTTPTPPPSATPLSFPPPAAAPAFPAMPPGTASATAEPPATPFPTAAIPAKTTPPWLSEPPAAVVSDVPPWLKNTTAPAPAPKPEPKPFLPTIRLAVPQGPQPLAARRPAPVAESAPATTVALPGYRAAPVSPLLPAVETTDPALDLDAPLPAMPPGLPPAIAVPAFPAATVPPAFVAAAAPGADAAAGKVFVERKKSSRDAGTAPHKRRFITPFRVGFLALLAAAVLFYAFLPQLRVIWEQRIQGKSSRPVAPPPPATLGQPARIPGDGSDVSIAPEPKSPAPPKTPPPAPAPPPEPAPAATPPASETAPVDTEPLPSAPPPGTAADQPDSPIPATETGAKELVSRLLYATSARHVSPYILDAAKLGPSIETYFHAGLSVPVSTHVCTLERGDKIPGTTRMSWLFRVTTDTVDGGFPVLVEQTADGLRADWELLSQCRDGALRKFLADPKAPPALFYTGLERRHPFPDMLPGKDHSQFMAFAIASPILGEVPANVFIPKSAPLFARAETLYKFGSAPSAPVLELTHKDGHVEITGIVRENWRVPRK